MLWYIYNRKTNLFWNNETGWGSLSTAEPYSDTYDDRTKINLPIDGEWVRADSHEARDWKDPDA